MGDRQRAGLGRGGGDVGGRLEAAEEVGLLEDHARRVLGGGPDGVGIGRAAVVRHLDDLHPEPGGEGAHDVPHLGVERLGDDDLRPAGRGPRDVAGVRRDRQAVVAGGVRDVHPGQLADGGLVLEDRLERPLAHLGLVGRVRGQELATLHHGVADRRDVVVVDAGPEELDLAARVDVPRRELGQVGHQLGLGERRLEVELTPQPDRLRDLVEELLDGSDADGGEHRVAVGVGECGERHRASTSSRYAAASISESSSEGSDIRTLISQPSP